MSITEIQKDKCTLSDAELAEACDKWVDKLIETGGDAWVFRIPADHNKCPDLLFNELITRFKEKSTQHDKEMEEFEIWKEENAFMTFYDPTDSEWMITHKGRVSNLSFAELLHLFRNRK